MLGTIPPTLLALLGALVILLTGAPAALHAQSAPSISIELSPGPHVPYTVALTGEVTLSNLAPADYSTVTLRADVTGHEDRTSQCYGEDTGSDIELAVDESLEAVTLRLFKPCTNAPGGFGTYDYRLDISVSRADPMQPGDTIELVSIRVHFLVSTYLTPGDVTLPPPAPSALAWMDPDPRTPRWYVGEWRRFRFRSDVSKYAEDHLGVYIDAAESGDFWTIGDLETPGLTAEEACGEELFLQNWRRAIHQTLWVVPCKPGPAVFWLTHEILGVPPLYTYEFEVLPARGIQNAPQFSSSTTTRSVAAGAASGTHVGAPVTATDADGETLEYSMSGQAAAYFHINRLSGQITVATTGFVDPTVQGSYSATVTARDPSGATASILVTITVGDGDGGPERPVKPEQTGGGPIAGGGGGGPSGPTPSEADFAWTVDKDIDALDAGNDEATGLWGDGATIWVAQNSDGGGDGVYAYDLASGERVEEREFELDTANLAPRGLWSDGVTIWVSDSGKDKLFAHDLENGERLEARDIKLSDANDDPRGIWSDRTTIWVLDDRDESVYLYDLGSGEQTAVYELDSANDDPHGIWSDGLAVWVSNHNPKRLFAYRLEDGALVRESDEDFTTLNRAGNNSPRGIWSDDSVMYVVDALDEKIYSYNMPDAIDARLASLALSGVDIGEFDGRRPVYVGVLGEGVSETTVEAEPGQSGASVAITPADADDDAENGHQAAIEDGGEITVTVTSEDGSRTRVYRVRIGEPEEGEPEEEDQEPERSPECLRGLKSARFSLVVYGGGSLVGLESCARSLSVTALYSWQDGDFVHYILGAPAFVNEGFVALFPAALPPDTPLIAQRELPPPEAESPSEDSP